MGKDYYKCPFCTWTESVENDEREDIPSETTIMPCPDCRSNPIRVLTLFVDSLKEWCLQEIKAVNEDGDTEVYDYGQLAKAGDLLKFAVQRLELIKEGK